MCFRPAEVAKPQVCPSCQRKVGVLAGIRQKKCPFCGTDMPEPAAEPITCPKCGAKNPADAKVCSNCGITAQEIKAAMNKPKKCPECGAMNPGSATNCLKCKASIPFVVE